MNFLSNIESDVSSGISSLESKIGMTSQSPQDVIPIGLPKDQSDITPMGFLGAQAALSNNPQITSAQGGLWDSVKNDMGSAIDWVEKAPGTLWASTKSGVSDIATGAENLASSAENAVTAPLKATYFYILLAVVVVGGVLYYIGKSGVVGQAASIGRP